MSNKKILTVFALLFYSYGCNDNPSSANNYQNFYPLNIGNRWEYKQQFFDSTGVATDSAKFTESVVGDTVIAGEKWYQYISIENAFPSGVKNYYINRPDGLYYFSALSPTPQLSYKYPVQVNEVYNVSMKIISVNEIVQTSDGKFNCVVYQQKTVATNYSAGAVVYINTFISPGIGKIKTELFHYSSQLVKVEDGIIELYQYQLN